MIKVFKYVLLVFFWYISTDPEVMVHVPTFGNCVQHNRCFATRIANSRASCIDNGYSLGRSKCLSVVLSLSNMLIT